MQLCEKGGYASLCLYEETYHEKSGYALLCRCVRKTYHINSQVNNLHSFPPYMILKRIFVINKTYNFKKLKTVFFIITPEKSLSPVLECETTWPRSFHMANKSFLHLNKSVAQKFEGK